MTLTVLDLSGLEMWPFHAFYAFSPEDAFFVISSEENTKHIKMLKENSEYRENSEYHINHATDESHASLENSENHENHETHEILENHQNIVAGGIALETKQIALLRGLQFTGVMEPCSESDLDRCRLLYLKRFPFAVLKMDELWKITIMQAKLTDNRLGFGTKLLWKKD